MRYRQRPTKAARRAALAELLAGLPEPPELPPECDMAEATTTSEIGVAKSITIHQDGRVLHGSTWIKPQDFATEEVQRGDLASLKGCTPPTLPTLDSDQAREVTHDNV